MTCNCNYGFFQGDDLVDVIKVNQPKNTEYLTITKAELQVGNLEPFVTENPTFPYTVSIMRNDSVKLSYANPIYLRIYYQDPNGDTVIRKTCIGSLNMKVNAQVVRDFQPTPEPTGV